MLHFVKIHPVVVDLRGGERQHGSGQMNGVPVDVQAVQHIFDQAEMQGGQVVLIAARGAKPLLHRPRGGHQQRSCAAGRVADLQCHQPVGIDPAAFDYGPIRRHRKARQQDCSGGAGIERPS